jgi:hypothetical protein
MLRLPRTLRAWDSADLAAIFKQELAEQSHAHLPLQQALRLSSSVLDTPITVLLQDTHATAQHLHIQAGIFYQGVTAGCSCADDPTPLNENTEYCVVSLKIDRNDAQTLVVLLDE